MTDLNTNQYLYRQPYLQNQSGYGDNNSVIPTSYDDKRLDPVKDKTKKDIKTNPVVSTAQAFIGEPVNIAIGTVPFLAIDRLLKWLPKGDSFDESNIGKKIIGPIDKLMGNLPKFEWIKNAYNNLSDTNFLKQIINAAPEKPRFSLAKGQVTPNRTTILTQMLDEAVELGGKKPETVQVIKSALDDPEIAEKFLTKFIQKADKKTILKKTTLGKTVLSHKNNMTVAERFFSRYGKVLNVNEFKETVEGFKTGKNIYEIAYEKAGKLAVNNKSELFQTLKNRADFFTGPEHSLASKFVMSIYNNMTTFLTANVGKLKPGNLGGNAMKIGGAAFMLFMGANVLGEIIKDTYNAPKGEKISTFAHGTIVKLGSWLMMLPIAIFMYKGLGSLNNLKGGNLISRTIKAPFRWLGNLLSVGLKTPKAKTLLGKIPEFLKKFSGGAGRLLLFLMVLSPLADKGLRFISHSIFGKPNALLAKEKAEAEKDNGKTEDSSTDNLKKALEQNKAGMITVAAKSQANNPMIEKYMKSHAEKLNKTDVTNSIADISPKVSDEISNSNKQLESSKKIPEKQQYIPSDTKKAQKEDQEKKAKFDATLAATDKAIKNAEKALGSN